MLCLQTTNFYKCECYNNYLIKNMNKENNTYHEHILGIILSSTNEMKEPLRNA